MHESRPTTVKRILLFIGFFGSTQKIGSNDDNIVYSFDDQYGRDESGCLGCDDEIREMINDSHRSGPGPVETVTELPVTLPPSQEDKDVLDTGKTHK